MATSKETERFLEGLEKEGKLPKEALAQLRTSLEASSDADNYIKGSTLRQDDYSRNISDLKAAQKLVEDSQKALQQKEAEVSKYQTELGTWKAGADQNYSKALQEREKAERKAAAAVAKVRTLAVASGLNEEDVLKDLDVTPATTIDKQTPQFDASKYLTREEVQKVTQEAALLDANIYDVAERHKEIFGTRLDTKGLVERAIKSGVGIEALWKQENKVEEKLEEKKEAALRAKLQTEFDEKETALRSSLSLPIPRAGRESDPYNSHKLFENPGLKKNAENLESNSGGVSAAIAAFNTGKYASNFKR
jgi:hypothetical protein